MHSIKKLFTIFSLIILLKIDVSADAGSSHFIKARIKVDDKEYLGYFEVSGYLYLEKDSIVAWKKDISKFTDKAKAWLYGDTLTLYSEVIELKDPQLILGIRENVKKFPKGKIKEIHPMDVINDMPGRGYFTKVALNDRGWLLSKIPTKDQFYSDGGACSYTALYFNKPDTNIANLVKAVEKELQKRDSAENYSYKLLMELIEKLRVLKVVVYSDCST